MEKMDRDLGSIGRCSLTPEPSQALRNHSPDGFEWGYGGSGPSQLALAIMLDLTGDPDKARKHYQGFKWDFLSEADKSGFEIREDEIRQWMAARETL